MIKAEIKDKELNLKVAGEVSEIFAELLCIIDGVSDATGDKKYFLKSIRKGIKHIQKHPLTTLPGASGQDKK